MDELAAAAKQDPVAYRMKLLERSPRAGAVLQRAAEKAGWGEPRPEGTALGVAIQNVFGSFLAMVAEVAVAEDGTVRVTRAVAAVDCGIVVNPDTVRAQIESAVVFGVTAALYGKVTVKAGRIVESNFDDYRAIRMDEAPKVDVHIVDSTEDPGGMGEAGTSVIVPAVTNAIFAATGQRLRTLPVAATQLRRRTG
jgi:isoquinoline 1-oxidoreductase beta subunit